MRQNKMIKGRSTIYIGHRHADKAIADVFRNAMKSWGKGQIRVFQSSDVRKNLTSVDQDPTDDHNKAFCDTNVVLLIFSIADNDWLNCMWECGLATDPRGQATKIVVFQYASDVPAPLRDQMRVTLDEESIKQFIHDFHKDPTFFPGCDEAFASEIDEKTICARSHKLFNELSDVC